MSCIMSCSMPFTTLKPGTSSKIDNLWMIEKCSFKGPVSNWHRWKWLSVVRKVQLSSVKQVLLRVRVTKQLLHMRKANDKLCLNPPKDWAAKLSARKAIWPPKNMRFSLPTERVTSSQYNFFKLFTKGVRNKSNPSFTTASKLIALRTDR